MPITVKGRTTVYYFRYRDDVTLNELKKVIKEYEEIFPSSVALHDFREANLKKISSEDVKKVGMDRSNNIKYDGGKIPFRCAIIVADSTDYGIIRCILSYGDYEIEKRTRVYYEIDDGIDWLNGLRQ